MSNPQTKSSSNPPKKLNGALLFMLLNKYNQKQETECEAILRILKLPKAQQTDAMAFIRIYGEDLYRGVSSHTLKQKIDAFFEMSEAERWYMSHRPHTTLSNENVTELGNLILSEAQTTTD